MTCDGSANGKRVDACAIRGKQHDEAFETEDLAFVTRFCIIGMALSYAVILGAPDAAWNIVNAFASYCHG